MSNVSYHVLNSSIVLNFNGKTVMLAESDERFEKVIELIKTNQLDKIPKAVDVVGKIQRAGLDVVDGAVHIDGDVLPDALSRRILDYMRKDLPFDSLKLFWKNLKQNPSFNSRLQLFNFLEHNGHPLTEDGCFIAYRGVTDDFKDLHTKTFDNSVGAVCEVPRESVDDNPNNTCSHGLHVACHSYAKDFGPKLVIVKVNPKDVVAVPTDYNGTKMRVSRFEVVALGEKEKHLDNEENPVYCGNDCADCECDDNEEEPDGVCYECGEEDQWGSYCSQCGEYIGG